MNPEQTQNCRALNKSKIGCHDADNELKNKLLSTTLNLKKQKIYFEFENIWFLIV